MDKTVSDVCALPLVQRLSAVLNKDPHQWRNGDCLPRGWHILLFAPLTLESDLAEDGYAIRGTSLPHISASRLMLGGRRTNFIEDIRIGEPVHRASRLMSVAPKQGRSGKITVVTLRHEIYHESNGTPAIAEEQDFVFLGKTPSSPAGQAPVAAREQEPVDFSRSYTPDERLLFRFSAATFNAHRIHYDHPYTTNEEHYPGLVVTGALTALLLLELFKDNTGHNLNSFEFRNVGALYCGSPNHLCGKREGTGWRLWAQDDAGRIAVQARIQ